MSWFSKFSRPAWESRDAATRAAAVASAQDPALIARLPDLARGDLDAEVRRAAVARVDDVGLLADRSTYDTDGGVRDIARARLIRILTDGAPGAAAQQRERQLRINSDAGLLEAVATQARDVSTRRVALERIERSGFLVERCLADPDLELRLWLLGRIDQPAALERIAERARRNDKKLALAARERANALRLESGDSTAIAQRLDEICAELEKCLARGADPAIGARIEQLKSEWIGLRQRAATAPDARFDGLIATLGAMSSAAIRAEQPAAAAADAVVVAEPAEQAASEAEGAAAPSAPAEPALAAEIIPPEPDAELIALLDGLQAEAESADARALARWRERWAGRWNSRTAHALADVDRNAQFLGAAALIQARLESAAQAQAAVQRRAREAIGAIEIALREGRSGEARQARLLLAQELEQHKTTPESAELKRLQAVDHELDKLAHWHHWSNDKVRTRLCDEIEALAGSGLHPDAVLNKIREAQAEWARLDASEATPNQKSVPSGLARRFRALCHRAIAPTRPYLEKRQSLRGEKQAQIESLLAEVPGFLADQDRRSAPMFAFKRRISDSLRLLDDIEPAARGELGRKLRDALNAIGAALDTRNAAAEEEKKKLLANLRRKLAQAAPADAVELAKESLQRWKALPPAARKTEDLLWKEYRSLVDPLYDAAKQQQKDEEQVLRAANQEATDVLDELAQLAQADSEHLQNAPTRLAALSARWRAAGRSDRDAERRFDRAVEQVHEAQRRAERQRGVTELQRLRDAARHCSALEERVLLPASAAASPTADLFAASAEPAAADSADFDAQGLPAASRPSMLARLQRAREWLQTAASAQNLAELHAAAQETAADLAVRAEFVGSVDSPEDQRDRRRNLQMQRLAARMSGATLTDPALEAREILFAWCALGPLTSHESSRYGERIDKALQGLL